MFYSSNSVVLVIKRSPKIKLQVEGVNVDKKLFSVLDSKWNSKTKEFLIIKDKRKFEKL